MDMWLTWVAILCVGIKAVPLPQTGKVTETPINKQQGEFDRKAQEFPNEQDIHSQASFSGLPGFSRQGPSFNTLPSHQFQGAQGLFSQNQNINPGGIFPGQGARGSSDLLHVVHPSLTGGVGALEELGIGSAGFAANNDNFFGNVALNGALGSSGAEFGHGRSNTDSNAFGAPGIFPEGLINDAFSARTRASETPGINRQFFDQSNLGHNGFGIQNFGGNNFAIPQLSNAGFGPFGPVPIFGTGFHPFGFNGPQFGQVPFPPAGLRNVGFTQNVQPQQPQVIVHSVPVVVSIFNDTHARLSPHNQLNGLANSQRNQLLSQGGGSSFSSTKFNNNAINTAETGSIGQAEISTAQATSRFNQNEGRDTAQIEESSLPEESKSIITNQSNRKDIDITSGGILNVNTGETKVKLGNPVSLSEVVQTENAAALQNQALPAPKALLARTQSPDLVNRGDAVVNEDASNTNVIPDKTLEKLASTGNTPSTTSSNKEASHSVTILGESATAHPTSPKSNATSLNKSSTHACALSVFVSESPSTTTEAQKAFASTDLTGFPERNADIKRPDVSKQDILPIPEALASFAAIGTPPFASGIAAAEKVTPLSKSGDLEPTSSLIPVTSALENDITTLRPQNLQITGTRISITTPPTTFNTQNAQGAGSSLLGTTPIPGLHPQSPQITGTRVHGTTPLPVLSPQISQVQDTLILSTTPQPTLQLQNTHIAGTEVFSTTPLPFLDPQGSKSTTAGVSITQLPSFSEGTANTATTDSSSNTDSQSMNEQFSSQSSNSTSITQLLVIPMNPLIAGASKTLQEGQVIAETGTSVGRVMQVGEPVFVGTNIIQAQIEPFQSDRSSLPKQSAQELVTGQHEIINKDRTLQPTEQLQSVTEESHTSSAFGNMVKELSTSQETPSSSSAISQQLTASQPSISGSTISLTEPKEILQQADLGGTSTFDQSQSILATTATSQLPGSPATILGSPAFPVSAANDHLNPDISDSNDIPALSNPTLSLVITPMPQFDTSSSHHQTDVTSGATENFSVHNQGTQPSQPIIIVESPSTTESPLQNHQPGSLTSQTLAQQLGTSDFSSQQISSTVGPVSLLANFNNQIGKTAIETTSVIQKSDTFQNLAKALTHSQDTAVVTTASPNVPITDSGVDAVLISDTSGSSGITVKNLGSVGSGGSVTTQIPIMLSSTTTASLNSQKEKLESTDTFNSKVNKLGLGAEISNGIILGQSAIVTPNAIQSEQQFQLKQESLGLPRISSSVLNVQDSSFSNNQQPVSSSSTASATSQAASAGQQPSARTSSPSFSVEQQTLAGTDSPISLTLQQSTPLTNSAQTSDGKTANAASGKGSIIGQNLAQNPNIVLAIPLSLLSQSAGTLNIGKNTPGSANQIGSSSRQNSNIFQNFSFTTDPSEVLKLVTRAQAMTANAVGSASISNNVFGSNTGSVQGSFSNLANIVTNNAQASQPNSHVRQQIQADVQEQPTSTAGGTQFETTLSNQQTPLSLTINQQANGVAGRPRVVSVVSPSGSLTFLPETVAKFSQALGFGVPLPSPSVVTLDRTQGAGASKVPDANKAQNGSKLGNTLKRESSH